MIVVLHAYSRVNSGDGLLVDLTLQRLARTGIKASDTVVVAMDPDSFAELPNVVKLGTAGRSPDGELARAITIGASARLASRYPGIRTSAAAHAIANADAFVAVGGGYLRAGTRVNALGTAINHLPQLVAAARSQRPSIYLPQSIGPLDGPARSLVGRRVLRALDGIDEVHVRDDRSAAELTGLSNIRRTPDLAVLDVADRLAEINPANASGPPLIIARSLGTAPSYSTQLRRLAELLVDPLWGVQADGVSSKSDRTFYASLGVQPDGRVVDLLGAGGPVVSVRLHGALQAILAGVPAIHLGYERKSWGAYEDLGLGAYVHPARSFDPEVVARQVRELQLDAEPFWRTVGEQAPSLQERSGMLDESISTVLLGRG